MGILEETETLLAGNGHYNSYQQHLARAINDGRQDYFDQIRYAMAISHQAHEDESADKLIFIGGLGVLGNIIRHLGTKIIDNWRGTRDLDLILREKSYGHIVSNSFDKIDFAGKSNSIRNKLSYRGYSADAEGNRLGATAVDAYIPNGSPKHGIDVAGVFIDDSEWESQRFADFFGIPIQVISPIYLLDMKLEVTNSHKIPRRQDLGDITTLLGLLEMENSHPDKLKQHLSPRKRKTLGMALKEINEEKDSSFFQRAIVSGTNKYCRSLIR